MNQTKENLIKKDFDSGMSLDVIVGKYANKRLDNVDEIYKVIKKHIWNKRKRN